MGLAVKSAFIQATSPGQPNAGMSFGEIYRHGLAVYIWRHEGPKHRPPLEELRTLMGTIGQVGYSNPIIRCFIDPAYIAEKMGELQISVEVQESREKLPSKRQVYNIAIVFMLSGTMDIW